MIVSCARWLTTRHWICAASFAVLAGTSATATGQLRFLESDVIDVAATDLAFDAVGAAHIAGIVGAYNTPGFDSGTVTNAGFGLRYVAKIDPATRKPMWIVAVGAPGKSLWRGLRYSFAEDEARGLALHASGNVYLVAHDGSTNYPITGGQYRWATAKHVFRVSPAGAVTRYSPPLDAAIRRVGAIAVDPGGSIYITGSAGSGLVTTANAPFPGTSVAAGCIAPFVMKLDPAGQAVVYSTYLGYAGTLGEVCGSGSPSSVFDPTGFAIAVDAAGNAVVGGQAGPGVRATGGSPDFGLKTPTLYVPVVGYYTSHAFVTKINATGTAMLFTARLGGSERDRVTSVVVDGAGAVYAGGKTASSDFPTTEHFGQVAPATFLTCPGFSVAAELGFVTKLAADGRQILYSGFLPVYGEQLANCGGNPDASFDPLTIARDVSGRIFATGTESSLRAYIAPVTSIFTINPSAVFFVIAADGKSFEYSTRYAGVAPLAAAIDPWGHFWVAGGVLKRFSSSTFPVQFSNAVPLCAPAATISARVAGANNFGNVEFFVDGTSAGSATVANDIASKTVPVSAGARRFVATYHGSSYFDGYSSEPFYMPVNQAGACQ